LVTGGTGFLGRRIVELLAARGDDVVTLARGAAPDGLPATHVRGDLCDATDRQRALRGVEVVFHVASKTGYWGSDESYRTVNVDGTAGLLRDAAAAGAGRFVYTSTPSVIGYAADAEGIAEAPYPPTWESPYGRTKAAAEQLVLARHSPAFATVALRPHLIIGPRDAHLLPRVVARARAGRLVRVGDGANLVDLTDVDNAAWAHLDAADALVRGSGGGRAYFLSNGDPVALWPWTDRLLGALGLPPVRRSLSLAAATRVGTAMELAWTWLPLPGEPPMTRFLAAALARAHWYDIGPAQRDLGYRVRVDMETAFERAVRSCA
jgi:nucleoside-diphosphate-sugar epimerase